MIKNATIEPPTDHKGISIKSQFPADVLQCIVCGQIVAGKNPENLNRVCLACCPRMKDHNPDIPFLSFVQKFPLEILPCPERNEQPQQDKGDCRCSR